MKKEIIVSLQKKFEEYVNVENGVEFWLARNLQELLEYSKWDNFLKVIEKAKTSCENSVTKCLIILPTSGKRSRYRKELKKKLMTLC